MSRFLAAALWLLPAAALAQHNVVPLKPDHFLDMRMYYGERLDGTYDAWTRFWFVERPNGTAQSFDNPSYPKSPLPFASFVVHGKWWVAVGELIHNPQITWRWKDKFFAGSQQLDRAALEEFPDLAKRLRNARFSFTKMRVRMTAKLQNGFSTQVNFEHDGVEFLIPAEGKKPYAVPGSPLKWSQVLSFDRGDPESDKQLRDKWKKIVSVTQPTVTFEGFQMPWSELESIALEYKERKKKKEELKKEYASVIEDKPAPVKPYRGGGDDAEPFEGQPPVPFRDDKAKTVSLKTKSGTVVKSWPFSEVYDVAAIPGTRSFVARTSKGARLSNARGELQTVAGETHFQEISFANSRYRFKKHVETKSAKKGLGCYLEDLRGKRYSSEYSAISDINDRIDRWERAYEEKRRNDPIKPGGIVIHGGCWGGATHVREWVTDTSLKVISTDDYWTI